MKEKWLEWKKRHWPPGKDQLLLLVLFGLLLAVIAVPANKNERPSEGEEAALPTPPSGTKDADADYEERTQRRLEELLGKVEGVGQVRVMLTFEGSGEEKVEKDTARSADESREETVYEEYGNSERAPYVTSRANPRVEGALIIAQGGGNGRVRQEIIEAAQALFGIEAHKIKIMKMEEAK